MRGPSDEASAADAQPSLPDRYCLCPPTSDVTVPHWTHSFVEDPSLFGHYFAERVPAAGAEVTDLLDLLEREHGLCPAEALDVACGIGRHAVSLAERGVDTLGIDLSPEYVERARERAAEAGVAETASFATADMRDLDAVGGTYDLVLNVWTSFGYYDATTNREVLEGMYRRVADGGVLVIEITNKEGLLADFAEHAVDEVGDRLAAETRSYDPETSRMRVTRREFVATDEGYTFRGELHWDHRLYAPVELVERCEAAGFDAISLYADFVGSELERASSDVVLVAEA